MEGFHQLHIFNKKNRNIIKFIFLIKIITSLKIKQKIPPKDSVDQMKQSNNQRGEIDPESDTIPTTHFHQMKSAVERNPS